MKNQWIACFVPYLLSVSVTAFAQMESLQDFIPQSGFYIGLGGCYNSAKLDQYPSASGISNVYLSNTLIASGEAGGPAVPFHQTNTSFAPFAQIGYSTPFCCNELIGGLKLFYQYLGSTVTNANLNAQPVDSFTNTAAAPASTSFIGNAVVQSAQTTVHHQWALVGFVGRRLMKGQVYLGLGPSLMRAHLNMLRAIGYVDVNGTHTDVTGLSTNFYNEKSLLGVISQIGMSHSLSPTLFLDINYSFSISGKYSFNDAAPFSSSTGAFTDTGTLYVNASQRITSQGVMASINKRLLF